jgi:hypothetical protein
MTHTCSIGALGLLTDGFIDEELNRQHSYTPRYLFAQKLTSSITEKSLSFNAIPGLSTNNNYTQPYRTVMIH